MKYYRLAYTAQLNVNRYHVIQCNHMVSTHSTSGFYDGHLRGRPVAFSAIDTELYASRYQRWKRARELMSTGHYVAYLPSTED